MWTELPYTGMTEAEYQATSGPIESHTTEPLTDDEIAELEAML